jgi:hypothetical protein
MSQTAQRLTEARQPGSKRAARRAGTFNPVISGNIMNIKHIIAVSAIAFLGTSAMAQEATYEYPTQTVAGKSRAEVKAELVQARAAGTLVADGEAAPNVAQAVTSGRSRAEVRAEALRTPSRNSYDSYNRRS